MGVGSIIIAATGHRPDKLGGYSSKVDDQLRAMARGYIEHTKPAKVISGMALGWDMAWAEAAIDLKVPVVAAIPFRGQEGRWPQKSRERYRMILSCCAEKHFVCPGGYAASKMQTRNEWMVDNCDFVAALWNGADGGTANCVRYAEAQAKPIKNLWDVWTKHFTITNRVA